MVWLEGVLEVDDEGMVEAGHDVTFILGILDVFGLSFQTVLPDGLQKYNNETTKWNA